MGGSHAFCDVGKVVRLGKKPVPSCTLHTRDRKFHIETKKWGESYVCVFSFSLSDILGHICQAKEVFDKRMNYCQRLVAPAGEGDVEGDCMLSFLDKGEYVV